MIARANPLQDVEIHLEEASGVPKQKVKLKVRSVLTSMGRDGKVKLHLALSAEHLLSTLKTIKITESNNGPRSPSSQRKKRARQAVRKVR